MRLTLIAAQSLDGFITRHETPGSAFASDADRAFFREALRGFDACVMGAGTYRSARDIIRRSLMPERLRVVITRNPATFASDSSPGLLEFHNQSASGIVSLLNQRGCRNGAILGGAQIHSLFFAAGLVDELWLTIEPLLFGSGTPLLSDPSDVKLAMLSCEHLSKDTVLLKYAVKR